MALVLVGAGGSGMSALAQLFVDLQLPDLVYINQTPSIELERYIQQGVQVIIGHGVYTVLPRDFVIYTAAAKHAPEVEAAYAHFEANHLHFPPMLYAQFLGELSKYLFTVAITGTHGKSTTTGMTATAAVTHLPQTALAIVGAGVTDRNGSNVWRNPAAKDYLKSLVLHIISRKHNDAPQPLKKRLLVVEADEFNHHFLRLHPQVSIITTLDYDHIDTYPTREDYIQAFRQFVQNTTDRVFVLADTAQLLSSDSPEAAPIDIVTPHTFSFSHLLGGHNHANASLAEAALRRTTTHLQQPDLQTQITQTISNFRGLSRRAELIGHTTSSVPVLSDYGHHPREIASTLLACTEKYPHTPLTCLFQPHQARRLLEFREEFVDALQLAEDRRVTPCYTAREAREEIALHLPPSLQHISSFDELTRTFADQAGAIYLADTQQLQAALESVPTGVIILFSAGDLDAQVRAIVT